MGKPQTESLRVNSDEEWHALRAKHIGGSEVGILLGVEKYMTRYELFHLKAGTLAAPQLDSERIILGTHLEDGILSAAKEIHGSNIRRVRRYVRRTDIPGMGASMDAEENIEGITGWVPAEVKLVAWNIWRDQWSEEEGGEISVPLHIQLQCQHYMAVTGAELSVLYVLVAGEKLHRIEVHRNEKIIPLIEQSIALFWKEVESGNEPAPDFEMDFDAMCRVMTNVTNEDVVDMTDDPALALLISQYDELYKVKKAAEKRLDAVKAEVLDRIGPYQKVKADGGTVSAKLQPAKPEKQITYKAQPAKRLVRVNPAKKETA